MFISPNTVRTLIANIYEKLNVCNKAQAIHVAVKTSGIILKTSFENNGIRFVKNALVFLYGNRFYYIDSCNKFPKFCNTISFNLLQFCMVINPICSVIPLLKLVHRAI
ncbi:MAG: LuxR C-terminal-related transcriptional regulator [bacterium]|nr:LuxR C-terminal-related transcriptional regulator [bacterium]